MKRERKPWDHHGQSRQARGYGAQWDRLRKVVLSRDRHLCQACLAKGRPTPASQVDHITPKAKGGGDELTNLRALCGPCHEAKTAEDAGRQAKARIGLDGWPVQG